MIEDTRFEENALTTLIPSDIIRKYNVELIREKAVEAILKEKAAEVIEDNEAFYIVNLSTIVKKYEEWTTNLPRVKPFYAIKCNPSTPIIKLLADLGANFDCASQAEMHQILGCGIASNRIIFANPCKMKSHLEFAKNNDVEMMTFDNSHELIKIADCYPRAKLLLRIITDDSKSVCRFSTKFGAPLDTTFGLLSLAKSYNLDVVGVSFHVGSGCMSSESFVKAIQSAHHVFKQAEEIGYQLNILDLGGGWPGDNNGRVNFPDIAATIRPILDELFPPSINIIAEPGRYFVAESHTMAVNVFAKRTVTDQSSGETHFLYYVNDGVYQSFNCILFDHYTPTPLVLNPNTTNDENQSQTPLFKSTIFGPTCDSMDCIGKDVMLPELNVGEWLYFKNMGAYTVAAASSFNGFKSTPATFYYY